MTAEEIRECAIHAAEVYHQYLTDRGTGLQIVDVLSIEAVDDQRTIFKLNINQRLFDVDAVVFRMLTTQTDYDTNQVKVEHYDRDQRNLIIKPEAGLLGAFRSIRTADLQVVSDLKFLVRRVQEWYEANGAAIALPEHSSVLNYTAGDEIEFFPDLQPSANQKAALRTIFSAPFSYIWGAPGTGKTQIVLSYALLHYLRQGKKVGILAPTNNAVEQVLRGVISMTDRANISRDDIIRLGNPTKQFAESYPEACEVTGLARQLKEIDEQLELLGKIAKNVAQSGAVQAAKGALLLFDDLAIIAEKITVYRQQRVTAERKSEALVERFRALLDTQTELIDQRDKLERKRTGFGHRLTKLFSTQPTRTERSIQAWEKEVLQITAEMEEVEEKLDVEKVSFQEIEQLEENAVSNFNKIVADLQSIGVDGAATILADLSPANHAAVRSQFSAFLQEKEQEYGQVAALAKDYGEGGLFPVDVGERMHILRAERERIAAMTTDERLKNVKIVACTLDTYIGRFMEGKMKVDHLFLDEAGYANVIKALTLFHHELPITFLGDHKQLPPVSEMNASAIQGNADFHDAFIWSQSAIQLEDLFHHERDTCLQRFLQHAEIGCRSMQMAPINQTFRFGSQLAAVLNQYVYQNGFSSQVQQGQTAIYFCHAALGQVPTERVNAAEVQAIGSLLPELGTDDFVILTPYTKQRRAIGRQFPPLRQAEKILTVHGSQGKEWHTVILSVSDTSNMWFTDTSRPVTNGINLINTAVSRAKKRLIIVCNHNFWVHQPDQLLGGLLRVAEPFTADPATQPLPLS